MLERCGYPGQPVKTSGELEVLDGLIIPGGESTTMGKLVAQFGLEAPIRALARAEKPILGTCAGMILLASKIAGDDQPGLGLIDMVVERNAFGRQIDSFEADLAIAKLGEQAFRAVFIRAPWAGSVGKGVEVLATYEGRIVMVQQENLLATAFHPELTEDARIHQLFLSLAGKGHIVS